jgi:uncharacterized protein YggT (Ycf19 family)
MSLYVPTKVKWIQADKKYWLQTKSQSLIRLSSKFLIEKNYPQTSYWINMQNLALSQFPTYYLNLCYQHILITLQEQKMWCSSWSFGTYVLYVIYAAQQMYVNLLRRLKIRMLSNDINIISVALVFTFSYLVLTQFTMTFYVKSIPYQHVCVF